MNKDFAGSTFPTEMGEIYGARVWRMSKEGKLLPRSIMNGPAWVDGENSAVCAKSTGPDATWVVDPTGKGRRGVAIVGLGLQFPSPQETPWLAEMSDLVKAPLIYKYQVTWSDGTTEIHNKIEVQPPPTHEAPRESCSCGFYAYTQPEHIELTSCDCFACLVLSEPRVRGLIKGYGNTLIGSKGFRCERAEIVALLDPDAFSGTRGLEEDRKQWMREQLLTRYPSAVLVSSLDELDRFAPLGIL